MAVPLRPYPSPLDLDGRRSFFLLKKISKKYIYTPRLNGMAIWKKNFFAASLTEELRMFSQDLWK